MSFISVEHLENLALPEPALFSFQKQVKEHLTSKLNSFSNKNVWEFLPSEKEALAPEWQSLDDKNLSSACEFTMEDKIADALLCFHKLDLLRMDQLYMFFSEARRVLKKDGQLLIVSLSKPQGVKELFFTKIWCLQYKRKVFQVDHYISPEDWIEMEREQVVSKNIRSEILTLKRR